MCFLTTRLFLLRNIFARQNIRLSTKVLKEMPLFSNCLTCSRYVWAGDYIFGRTCTSLLSILSNTKRAFALEKLMEQVHEKGCRDGSNKALFLVQW